MTDTSFTVPVVVGPQGRVNTPPVTLQQNLLALVAGQNPGYIYTMQHVSGLKPD